MTEKKRRRPVPGRARKRAIRAHAAQTGVAYSIAAHLLDDGGAEPTATVGQTVYPAGTDEHRQWLIAVWQQRRYERRVRDAHEAAQLPLGRGEHLAQRFPTTRGEPGTGVGPLYHGERREAAIAMLYAVVAHEQPELCPAPEHLVWIAELGEDAAMDLACAGIDRAARRLLDDDRWRMWARIEAAIAAGRTSPHRPVRDAARALGSDLCTLSLGSSVDGARHTLDALLVASDGGHAPGTRVRVRARPHRGRAATIVGVRWADAGTVLAYDVRLDDDPTPAIFDPAGLTLARWNPNSTPRTAHLTPR